MPDTRHAIEIEDLGISLDDRWVLRGFGLAVTAGEKVALTGPSGAGKSTLLKSIMGLVAPREGAIRVFGRLVDGHGVWAARRSLAYVAQEPDLGPGTVTQALERPFTYKANADLRGNLARLPLLLERFNLPPAITDKEAASLSGGEKQRIALIAALLLDRPVILLDEASSALDQANRQAIADYIAQAGELTVLSVAHDTEWLSCSDRVLHMGGASQPAGEHP